MFRQKAPRDSKEANYEPGIEKMMEYAKRERMQARLPPVEDVAHAIKRFAGHLRPKKTKKATTIEDTQAQLVLQSLRYCLDAQRSHTDDENHVAAQTSLQSADLKKLAKYGSLGGSEKFFDRYSTYYLEKSDLRAKKAA